MCIPDAKSKEQGKQIMLKPWSESTPGVFEKWKGHCCFWNVYMMGKKKQLRLVYTGPYRLFSGVWLLLRIKRNIIAEA